MHAHFSDVLKRYDSGFVLEVPDLKIGAGDRVGLVGNNGAGKTTLLRLLLGLLRLQRGDIRLNGESVRSFSLSWRSGTSSYIDETSLIPFLNPWEFWEFVGDVYGVDRKEWIRRLREYDGFVELATGRRGKKKYIRDYSQGNRKKIGLVASMIVRPKLLVLDEPFTHLDPRSRAALEHFLLSLNADHGTTLFVSSHDLENIVEVSDRILLLEDGRIHFDGDSGQDTLQFVRGHLTGGSLRRAAP